MPPKKTKKQVAPTKAYLNYQKKLQEAVTRLKELKKDTSSSDADRKFKKNVCELWLRIFGAWRTIPVFTWMDTSYMIVKDAVRNLKIWTKYKDCNRLPNFWDYFSMNTFLAYWKDLEENKNMQNLLNWCDKFLPILNDLDRFIEDPINEDEKTVCKWLYVRKSYFEEIFNKIDQATYLVLSDEPQMKKLDFWRSDYFCGSNTINVNICFFLQYPVSNLTEKISEFSNIGFKVLMPQQYSLKFAVVRVIHTKFDYLSTKSRLSEPPEPFDEGNPVDVIKFWRRKAIELDRIAWEEQLKTIIEEEQKLVDMLINAGRHANMPKRRSPYVKHKQILDFIDNFTLSDTQLNTKQKLQKQKYVVHIDNEMAEFSDYREYYNEAFRSGSECNLTVDSADDKSASGYSILNTRKCGTDTKLDKRSDSEYDYSDFLLDECIEDECELIQDDSKLDQFLNYKCVEDEDEKGGDNEKGAQGEGKSKENKSKDRLRQADKGKKEVTEASSKVNVRVGENSLSGSAEGVEKKEEEMLEEEGEEKDDDDEEEEEVKKKSVAVQMYFLPEQIQKEVYASGESLDLNAEDLLNLEITYLPVLLKKYFPDLRKRRKNRVRMKNALFREYLLKAGGIKKPVLQNLFPRGQVNDKFAKSLRKQKLQYSIADLTNTKNGLREIYNYFYDINFVKEDTEIESEYSKEEDKYPDETRETTIINRFLDLYKVKDLRNSELNLRKYKIVGGVYYLDFIKSVNQKVELKNGSWIQINYGEDNIVYDKYGIHHGTSDDEEEEKEDDEEEEEEEGNERKEKLISVELKLQLDNWMVYKMPRPVLWDYVQNAWLKDDIHIEEVDEKKKIIKFKFERTAPIGLYVNRYEHLPYHNWDLQLILYDDQPCVQFKLIAKYLSISFVIKDEKVCLSGVAVIRSKDEETTPLHPFIGKFFQPNELIIIMRNVGVDVFPDDDAVLYLKHNSFKDPLVVEHVYRSMAIYSYVYQFCGSKFNKHSGFNKIIYQLRKLSDLSLENQNEFLMIVQTFNELRVVNGREDDSKLLESDVGYEKEFIPDLLTFLSNSNDQVSVDQLLCRHTKEIGTVYDLLHRIKPFSHHHH